MSQDNTIARIGNAGEMHDNRRRGNPKNGCDCVQCFGYCIVEAEVALRQRLLKHDADYRGKDKETAT